MGQGVELSELQQRVETVGMRFGEVAEDSRQRGERLASLLDQVEKGVVRSRHEIDRLTRALAEAREENAQTLALLQSLLAMAEKIDGPGERIVLCDLEARVDRLRDQAVAMNAAGNGALEAMEKATRKSDESGNGALDAGTIDADGQEEGAQDEDAGESEWEPIPDEEAEAENGPPLELTRMIADDGELKDVDGAPGRADMMESGAVQDIFKRVSMMTGRLRET